MHPLPITNLILIVDDDPFLRMQLSRALEKEGYQVIAVSNGEEGLAACKSHHPDVILLDAMMPMMDGFECCLQLRGLTGGDRRPILMITGLEDSESVDRAFEAGAADYVTKPIHWPVLRQRVRRLLEQSRLRQELEVANELLQRLIALDGLTQVASRRRFDECLQQEWLRLARDQLPLSLILCDIDFFKVYNDSYGHIAGDHCLQQVARAIDESVKRPADLVARYGGDEFAVILPHTLPEAAIAVAENIRARVKALEIECAHSQISPYVTLSLGVASIIPERESSPKVLIATADKALYQAKAAGRNRYASNP